MSFSLVRGLWSECGSHSETRVGSRESFSSDSPKSADGSCDKLGRLTPDKRWRICVDELLWSDEKTGRTTDYQDTHLSTDRLKEVLQRVGELGKSQNKSSECPIPVNTLKNWIRSPEAYKDIEYIFEQKRTSLEKSGVDPAKISKIFSWGRHEQYSQAAGQMKGRVLDALKTILTEIDS